MLADLDKHIEELGPRQELCRRRMMVSKILVILGSCLLLGIGFGPFRFREGVFVVGIAMLSGGILWWYSNKDTLLDTRQKVIFLSKIRADIIAVGDRVDDDDDDDDDC